MEKEKQQKKKREFPPLVKQKGGTYFHCGAIIGRKNVFVTDEYIDILTNAFRMAEVKHDIKNLSYVIMPNFFYWMFRLNNQQDDPVKIYGELKKDVAREIIFQLRAEERDGRYRMANLFRFNERVGRSSPERILENFAEYAKKFPDNRKYRVWAPRTEIMLLNNENLIQQKMTAIKKAPTSERWQFVENAEKYPYLFIADEMIAREINLEMPGLSEAVGVAV